jgi:hypothetical protein
MRMRVAAPGGGAPATPVAVGEETLRLSLTVTYELLY